MRHTRTGRDKANGRRRPAEWAALARCLSAAGTSAYLAHLVDLAGELVAHDRVTVTRYVAGGKPEFLTHRNFSDDLVERYLAVYYPFDPFHTYWTSTQRTGVVPLSRFTSRELKQGRYIAEFLAQSAIRDEVGLLLDDGPRATLGIFLERAARVFSPRDVDRLENVFPALEAVHLTHRRLSEGIPARARKPVIRRAVPARQPPALDGIWPELSSREREVVALILAGHASSGIATRLGISAGTVRNHRLSIYAKLDITTEREIFLSYLDHMTGTSAIRR
ncbi:MAG: LuxR C-terminal-related transcriptional regulator [Hyphomicrobiaceae bacterium]